MYHFIICIVSTVPQVVTSCVTLSRSVACTHPGNGYLAEAWLSNQITTFVTTASLIIQTELGYISCSNQPIKLIIIRDLKLWAQLFSDLT